MAEKISIQLNKGQQAAIKKAMGSSCEKLEFNKEDLVNRLLYMPAPVMIDFDDQQKQALQKAFPGKKCNYAILDGNELCNVLRYMPPPNGTVKYMPPRPGLVKYMPPPIIVKYMPPAAKKSAK
jgi:hypothetical protein